MMSVGSKRKPIGGADGGYGEERMMHLLFRSFVCRKAGALFEFKFRITTTGDIIGEDDVVFGEETLKLISTFYKQEANTRLGNVACAPFGSGMYFLMPNEFDPINKRIGYDYTRSPPCLFDAIKVDFVPIDLPEARKGNPFAIYVGGKIYVLARRNPGPHILSEPSFESYDIKTHLWESLDTPEFNKKPDCSALGYAVLGNFILVCVWNFGLVTRHACFSFDTNFGKWKRVYDEGNDVGPIIRKNTSYVDDDDEEDYDAEERVWDGEGVVIGNFIYAYVLTLRRLISYSCTKATKKGYDFSLGVPVIVEGYEPHQWTHRRVPMFEISGAIGKINDKLLCVINTCFSNCYEAPTPQPVHVSIVRIDEEEPGRRCTRLKSLLLYMPVSTDFDFAKISSCLLLQPEHGERSNTKHALPYKGTDADLVSEVELTETGLA